VEKPTEYAQLGHLLLCSVLLKHDQATQSLFNTTLHLNYTLRRRGCRHRSCCYARGSTFEHDRRHWREMIAFREVTVDFCTLSSTFIQLIFQIINSYVPPRRSPEGQGTSQRRTSSRAAQGQRLTLYLNATVCFLWLATAKTSRPACARHEVRSEPPLASVSLCLSCDTGCLFKHNSADQHASTYNNTTASPSVRHFSHQNGRHRRWQLLSMDFHAENQTIPPPAIGNSSIHLSVRRTTRT
jgi:hypothetical protein